MWLASFGNSLLKAVTLALGSFFPMMQCLFDELLSKSLKPFNRIWFFLKSGILRII
jgi:hypothetical protein